MLFLSWIWVEFLIDAFQTLGKRRGRVKKFFCVTVIMRRGKKYFLNHPSLCEVVCDNFLSLAWKCMTCTFKSIPFWEKQWSHKKLLSDSRGQMQLYSPIPTLLSQQTHGSLGSCDRKKEVLPKSPTQDQNWDYKGTEFLVLTTRLLSSNVKTKFVPWL